MKNFQALWINVLSLVVVCIVFKGCSGDPGVFDITIPGIGTTYTYTNYERGIINGCDK